MDELTERKRTILQAVVLEYVETAEPVGSALLVDRYALGVGPATVRHELAEMSERGYLEQPHTSSGRIPSDSGYRYYVRRIAEPHLEPGAERRVLASSKTEAGLEELLQETCRLLSRLSQYFAVASTLGETNLTIRNISITSVTPQRVLLIVVIGNGMVEHRIVDATPDLTLADLQEVAGAISEAAGTQRLRMISKAPAPEALWLGPPAKALLARAWKTLRSVCRAMSAGKVVSEGAGYFMAQPEFQRDMGALAEILAVLDDHEAMQNVLDRQDETGTSVSIGSENSPEPLRSLAIITSRFYLDDLEAGAIAVVGPTRMRYEATIPLVEAAARALTDSLGKLLR